jgi:hypothetical protein
MTKNEDTGRKEGSARPRLAWRLSAAAGALTVLTSHSIAQQTEEWPWDGPYTPIPVHAQPGQHQHCCEVAHALLIGKGPHTGKVLLIQSNGDRWLWDPAAPRSVSREPLCDMIAPTDDMFCSGHSADGNGDLVVVGGARHRSGNPTSCAPQPKYSGSSGSRVGSSGKRGRSSCALGEALSGEPHLRVPPAARHPLPLPFSPGLSRSPIRGCPRGLRSWSRRRTDGGLDGRRVEVRSWERPTPATLRGQPTHTDS